jgi:hypothetical protein
MFAELEKRSFRKLIPDHKLVVVPTRSELAIFTVPSEATDFLLVPNKLA